MPWYALLRDSNDKYIRNLVEGEREELYDLDADPEQLTNLAARPDHAALLKELRAKAIDEVRRTEAKFVERMPKTMAELNEQELPIDDLCESSWSLITGTRVPSGRGSAHSPRLDPVASVLKLRYLAGFPSDTSLKRQRRSVRCRSGLAGFSGDSSLALRACVEFRPKYATSKRASEAMAKRTHTSLTRQL